MRVLGISPDVWISSAALVEDGVVVAAAAEERFTRQKMTGAFPRNAIRYCLEQGGIGPLELDAVAVAWNPGAHIRSPSGRYTDAMRWRGEYLVAVPGALQSIFGNPEIELMEEHLRFAGGDTSRIVFVSHHLAHAACAYHLSPFERAAVLTVDGRGEKETCCWFRASDQGLEQLGAVELPHSLGIFYSAFAEYLGFKPHSDEWKVMALAAYGREDAALLAFVRSLVRLQDQGRFELDLSYFEYYLFDKQPRLYSSKLVRGLGPERAAGQPLEQRHKDIARALQQVFEETFAHMLAHLSAMTGEADLALAGGAAMNSVFNGKILGQTAFRRLFVPSCPDDTGVSVGAALHASRLLGVAPPRQPQVHNFWGPGYTDQEIRDELVRCKIAFRELADVPGETAGLLARGLLVGWLQGRMEFGQRALGNRSILADPRDARVKDVVNAAVKYREEFRPFAPAVLAERAHEYFDLPGGDSVDFMEKVYPVRPEKRAEIAAVVHHDGTGRLQTVRREGNPLFHELIARFGALTGTPVLLNTSFNLNGEPIVMSPRDAIRTFYSCGLDALVLGRFLVVK